ncbi:MAG: valine--pyruvate transaminase [Sedimentisphaerales bacterium]|nr:valine--pyruvate transaminase [Sedimentisphaerales bacterium]
MNISNFGRKIAVQSGIGQLMDDLGAALAQKGDVLMLGGGNPAHVPEVERYFRRSMEAILADSDRFERTVGDYDPPGGNVEFRRVLAHLLREQFGWDISLANIALTSGSQSAFFILFNLFGGRYEDGTVKKILLPLTPEYVGYSDVGLTPDLFTAIRPKIEHLDQHLFKYHIDFDNLRIGDDIGAICISRPTNPSGNVLTDSELERLSDITRARNVPLIVDNAYGTPFPHIIYTDADPIWDQNTIVCMSLSKLGLPATRTGIVIAREEVVEMVARVNAVLSLAPVRIGAALATDLVRSGEIVRLSRDLIAPFYHAKAQHALELVTKHFDGLDYRVHRPEGAFFLWLWLPNLPIASLELYERLKARRVIVVSGHYFFPGLTDPWPHKHECLRLSYAQNEATVAAGIQTIAEEVRRAHAAPS